MWHLNAPYRFTMGGLVLVTLGIGVASHNAAAPASYAWFGMGATIFSGVYYGIIMIVRERLGFYTEMARDSNAKQSIKYLKIACYIFFTVWMIYPLLWVLGTKGFGLISGAPPPRLPAPCLCLHGRSTLGPLACCDACCLCALFFFLRALTSHTMAVFGICRCARPRHHGGMCVCVCVCVCVHIFMHVYIYVYIYIHTYMYDIHIYDLHVCSKSVYVYMYALDFLCVCVYA